MTAPRHLFNDLYFPTDIFPLYLGTPAQLARGGTGFCPVFGWPQGLAGGPGFIFWVKLPSLDVVSWPARSSPQAEACSGVAGGDVLVPAGPWWSGMDGVCAPRVVCTQGPVGIWAPHGLGEAGGRARGPARPCARLESELVVPLESPSY